MTDKKKGPKKTEEKQDAEELAKKMGLEKPDFLIIMDRGKYKKGYETTESQLRKDYKKYILGK